jgi:hypothetical protein
MKLLYLLFVLLVLQSQAKRDRKKDFLFSPDGVGGSAVGVVVGQGGAGVRKRVVQILAGERGESVASRLAGRHGGQALLDVAVLLEPGRAGARSAC